MAGFTGKLKNIFGKVSGTREDESHTESTGVLLPMEFENNGTVDILILTRAFSGGVKNYLLALIDKLGKEGFRIHIAGPGGSLVDDLKTSTIMTFPLEFSDRLALHEDWSAARKLAKIIRNENIKLVHAQGYKAAFIAGLAAKKAKTPVTIVTLHDFVFNEGSGKMKHLYFDIAEHFMPAMVDKIITVSKSLRKRVLEKGKIEGSKVIVINAGVRPLPGGAIASRRILNVKDMLALNTAAPLIVTVGSLHSQKGIKYLLTAATHVLREFPNAQFLIVGDGPQKHELDIVAEKSGIHKRVTFTGWRDDARDIMAAADIIVLPSMIEGMPYSILEAMAAGKPVVSTLTGGIPEVLIDRETGFLVPPKKPMAIAKAIIYLLQNRDIAVQMGMAGKRRSEELFDLKRTIKETVAAYTDLLDEYAEYENEQAAQAEAKITAKQNS